MLSYLSKRQASTTKWFTDTLFSSSCHTYPNDRLLQQRSSTGNGALQSCHTYPNDRLLQRMPRQLLPGTLKLSYLSKRQASTTRMLRMTTGTESVVIPIQTIGFYNFLVFTNLFSDYGLSYLSKRQASTTDGNLIYLDWNELSYLSKRQASTTKPMKRTLQKRLVVIPIQTIGFYNVILALGLVCVKVVIPIQTIGFYNLARATGFAQDTCCHTYPNDRLLQRLRSMNSCVASWLSYLSKRQASTTRSQRFSEGWLASCHTYPNDRLLQPVISSTPPKKLKLSYLSKRQASTTCCIQKV